MSDNNKLILAFWISKRLFHNYVFFNEKTSFGDIDVMLDALNLIEQFLSEDVQEESEIRKLIGKVDENTPDTEDFSSITVSFALDACLAIKESLTYILDNDITHIVNIGVLFRDTIDMYIQEKENVDYSDENFERSISDHPIMKTEMRTLNNVIFQLKEGLPVNIEFQRVIDPEVVF